MTDIPDTRVILRDLNAGRVPYDEIYAAIHALGHHGAINESKRTVEAFLRHDDPQLRNIALNVLTIHWHCLEHRGTCERFAKNDPDPDNRRMGISGIGALLEGTRDRAVLKLLLEFFHNDAEENHIRHAAYCSILYVLGAPIKEQPLRVRNFDLEKDINWERIAEAQKLAIGD